MNKKCVCGHVPKNQHDYDNHIYCCKEYEEFNYMFLIFIILFMATLVFIRFGMPVYANI